MENVNRNNGEGVGCKCDITDTGKSQDPRRLPRPPDVVMETGSKLEVDDQNSEGSESYDDDGSGDYSDDDDVKQPLNDKNMDNPIHLLQHGEVIVPHYPSPMSLHTDNMGHVCRSQGNVGLQGGHHAQHVPSNLVWIGSSLNTMHQVPLVRKDGNVYSHDLKKSPSMLSSTKMMSSRYSSLTVSECGTDMCAQCRICQMPGDDRDPLISPCRCAGSLRYVHTSCLKKWVRISQRRGRKQPPRCELCHFQFMRHKQFKFSQWRWPRVRPRDKCLHIIFILNLLIMIGCAIATIMCFLSDRDNAVKFPKDKVKLTSEEVITLTCGVMFFVAFFIAMTVEIKARHTLYKLFLRFITHNTEWTVDQYDISKDPMFKRHMTASQV